MNPKIKESRLLYSGFFNLREDILEKENGETRPLTSLIIGVDAVAVIAKTQDGKWILNREYRHSVNKTVLGPPGGRLEFGEDPILGAQRELFEETGYWSDNIQIIGCCHPLPGVSDQKIFYILAKDAYKKDLPSLEPFEFIEIELKTDEELIKEIEMSPDIDGNLCIALWYTQRNSKFGAEQEGVPK